MTISKISLEPTERASVFLEEIKRLDAMVIEPEVQLIIPTTLVPGLIRALTAQKEVYEELYKVQIKEVGAKDE